MTSVLFRNHDTPLEKIKEPMQRMHSYVMGPGLGRTPEAGKIFQDLVAHAADKGNPLVIDAVSLSFSHFGGGYRGL